MGVQKRAGRLRQKLNKPDCERKQTCPWFENKSTFDILKPKTNPRESVTPTSLTPVTSQRTYVWVGLIRGVTHPQNGISRPSTSKAVAQRVLWLVTGVQLVGVTLSR